MDTIERPDVWQVGQFRDGGTINWLHASRFSARSLQNIRIMVRILIIRIKLRIFILRIKMRLLEMPILMRETK